MRRRRDTVSGVSVRREARAAERNRRAYYLLKYAIYGMYPSQSFHISHFVYTYHIRYGDVYETKIEINDAVTYRTAYEPYASG